MCGERGERGLRANWRLKLSKKNVDTHQITGRIVLHHVNTITLMMSEFNSLSPKTVIKKVFGVFIFRPYL